MSTGAKLKTALVGIGVVSALALSSGGAAYASGVRPDIAGNGCVGQLAIDGSGYAVASATAGSAACLYSFQYRDEPSGATGVVYSGSLNPGQSTSDAITFIPGQQLRTCTHANGVTNCTGWES